MKTSKIVAIVAFLLMCLPALTLLAQGPPSNPPSGGPGSGAPIDGGISALIVGSAVMGYKKMKARKAEKNQEKAEQ